MDSKRCDRSDVETQERKMIKCARVDARSARTQECSGRLIKSLKLKSQCERSDNGQEKGKMQKADRKSRTPGESGNS